MNLENIIVDVIIPIVTALIGAATIWIVQKNLQEKKEIERRLSEKRQETYRDILDPFIRMLTNLKAEELSKEVEKLKSYEYKKITFELNLVGSDEVVLAYNNLMQYIYRIQRLHKSEGYEEKDPTELLRLWGNLMLEIRKSLGHKNTKLDEWDMFRGTIKDIDKVAEQ
jgi:hypothetical protein